MLKKTERLRENDRAHLWHPFTSIDALASTTFPVIERADGVFLYDTDGNRYYDGISSWWCMNLGHRHPKLVKAMQEQAARLDNSILGGMSHENAVLLAEEIARITPGGLMHTLFASDGACAAEAALKIALQYWANNEAPRRNRFVSLADGYHGDTLGAVSVGYVERFHRPFSSLFTPSLRAPSPRCFHCRWGKEPGTCSVECFNAMESIIEENAETVAACIVEPLCQGAAGMRIYPAAYLKKLRDLTRRHHILLIIDEIAVGFGRTGKLFASLLAGIEPDIMCLGKALTGGMLPLSATVVTDEIYESFRSAGGRDRTFYHGHSTCGSPITMQVARTACNVYEEDKVLENAAPAMRALEEGFARLAGHRSVYKTAALGMMSSLEITEDAGGAAYAAKVALRAAGEGLFIRPLGDILYLWPPLTTTEEEMHDMLAILERVL